MLNNSQTFTTFFLEFCITAGDCSGFLFLLVLIIRWWDKKRAAVVCRVSCVCHHVIIISWW